MSMHRRPVGRPRLLAGLGSVVILVGSVLPWWTLGGGPGELTLRSGNAFESLGIVVFLAALATLALISLPYARERPVAADRWTSYALLAAVAWLAFLLRIADLALSHYFSFFHEPIEVVTRISGLWVTALGLVIHARAAYDLWQAPRDR
jgi:Zn-dependent protease with chaperone function